MEDWLKGLRVVEGSTYAAVAQGGRQLAAWGADVVRVDPIGAAVPPLGPAWRRGKRSIAIDLRRPPGQALLAQLITAPGPHAGAWCSDWPGQGALAPEALRRERDDLLAVHLPDDGRAQPSIAGPAICSALLAAVFHRERRGSGLRLTLPTGTGAPGSAPPCRAAAQEFITRDGQGIALDGFARARWPALVRAAGVAAQVSALAARLDLNFDDEGHRLQACDALADLLAPWFSARTRSEATAVLDAQGIAWRPAEPGEAVGQHTDELLAEVLGLSSSQIGRLHDAGLVAGPQGPRTRCGTR